jgi:hypothetical protein
LLKNLLSIGSPDAEPKKRGDFNFVSFSTCASSRRIAGFSGFHSRHAAGRGVFQQTPKVNFTNIIPSEKQDLELLLTLGAKQNLQRAAAAAQRSVSEFVLESALANAA